MKENDKVGKSRGKCSGDVGRGDVMNCLSVAEVIKAIKPGDFPRKRRAQRGNR